MTDKSYFLIISLRRCGSTYLSFTLNQHQDVFCDKEFVKRDHDHLKDNHISIVGGNFSFCSQIDTMAASKPICGSKVTIPEYQRNEIQDILDPIEKEPIKVIHIVRSLSQQYISLQAAKMTNIWHVLDRKNQEKHLPEWSKQARGYIAEDGHNALSEQMFTLNPIDVGEFCERAIEVDQDISGFSNTHDYLRVSYDDLDQELPTIFDFIGTKKAAQEIEKGSQTKKVIQIPHKDLVTNWGEVSELFNYWETQRTLH